MDKRIEIPLSKSKVASLWLGCFIFVAMGIWYIILPGSLKTPMLEFNYAIQITGAFALVFFGIGLIVASKFLFDRKPGLIIDDLGIADNSTLAGIGTIQWQDIEKVSTRKILWHRMLKIWVKNPNDYIQKAKNRYVKGTMKCNFRKHGSPLFISSDKLIINHDELEKLVSKELSKRKSA